MKTNLTGADIQDLFHYALAAANRSDSTFDSETLAQRLTAGNALRAKIYNHVTFGDVADTHYPDEAREFRSEAELKAFGEKVLAIVIQDAAELAINPVTGEKCAAGEKLHL